MFFGKNPLSLFVLKAKVNCSMLLQVVMVNVLPPSVSRFYLGEVGLKLQYLVCLLWMLLFNLSRLCT